MRNDIRGASVEAGSVLATHRLEHCRGSAEWHSRSILPHFAA